jgi:integrase
MLTDITIRNAKPKDKPYKLSDAKGMYLLIKPNGGKYWRLKYRFTNKENHLALGVYPEVTLNMARDKRDEARKVLANGVNPSQAKKDIKRQKLLSAANSFEALAREWHANQSLKWTENHAMKAMRRLEADVFPMLGARAVNEITAPELLSVIRQVEKRGALELSHRVLQMVGQIFRYGIVTGCAQRDIAADLRGALKVRKKQHYASLKPTELPEFIKKLEEYDGDLQTKLGLKLLMLTFVRTGELRAAKWEEIDFEKKEWRIPAERMKMREMHIVPLAKQVLALLKALQAINSHSEYLFPNRNRPTTFISENTLLYAIYRMGYHSRATGHGFRATASTVLNEHGFRSDVIERQLAHAERDDVRASYNYAQYLPERHKMMQWWGDYLEAAANSGKVIVGNFGVAQHG